MVERGRISILPETRYCNNLIKLAEYSPHCSNVVLHFGHDFLCKFLPSASVLKLISNGRGGSLLFVRPHLYTILYDCELMNFRFGTPISLLVKRFSAARVLPIMMVGFVSCSSVTNCFIHNPGL